MICQRVSTYSNSIMYGKLAVTHSSCRNGIVICCGIYGAEAKESVWTQRSAKLRNDSSSGGLKGRFYWSLRA